MKDRKIIQKMPKLDRYCRVILIILILIGRKVRFNELWDFLLKRRFVLSKPTLSQHLKHLTAKKMVIRRVEDVQYVSYEVNYKRFGNLEGSARCISIQKFMIEENQLFDAVSLDDQIDKVFEAMLLRNLYQLKAQIEFESNPELTFEESMELTLQASPLFMHYENWLVTKCKRDEGYREKVVQKIDSLILDAENVVRHKGNKVA
jgi:DNA-binding transcriptional ArsR family regulator